MGIAETIALSMGVAWASGINLYAAVLMLGVLQNTGHLALPPELMVLSDPLVMGAAFLMYTAEFFADKVPGVDTGWDTLHTFVRIPAGAVLAAAITTMSAFGASFWQAAAISAAVSTSITRTPTGARSDTVVTSTTSAPRPSVSASTLARRSSRAVPPTESVTSAPIRPASSSRASGSPITTSGPQPRSRAKAVADRPTGPAPWTTTVSPGRGAHWT